MVSSHLTPVSSLVHHVSCIDMICCFVELIENPPWTARKKDGHSVKFINGKWQKIEDGELMKLTKLEGQVS